MQLELGLVEALELIAGKKCENYTGDHGSCFVSGRTLHARYGADRACDACIAWVALETQRDLIEKGREPEQPREITRVLDLFCGAGGAGMGYHRAWPNAEIIGVDLHPQPRYPFAMFRGDVRLAMDVFDPASFDFIHASPPCQAHTTMSNRHRGKGGKADSHTDYIDTVRAWLIASGKPYVIENVPGARKMLRHPVTLSGGMFGLGVERPRLFECSFPVVVPPFVKVTNPVGVYGAKHDGRRLWTRKDGTEQRAARTLEEGRAAMGVDWMEWRELAESIPPAYTEWLAGQFDMTLEAVA